MSEDDLRKAWERGKPMDIDRVRKASSSVLSIRLPDSVFEALTERARYERKAAGTLARELLESAVAAQAPITPPSLASMFTKWVGEAMDTTRQTLEFTYTSPSLSNGLWASCERVLSETNYFFASQLVHFSGFKEPIWTSRKTELETEPAGEEAA